MKLLCAGVAFLLGMAPSHAADQKWVEVRSPNFAVATDAGERRGREIALRFEQMRRLFLQLIPRDKLRDTEALRIVAFKGHDELTQVTPMWRGKPVEMDGVYLKGPDGAFIAIDAGSLAGWRPVFHEYAHFLVDRNFPPTPLWFDEGFADYYSTIRSDKSSYYIGEVPEGYGELLQAGLMPLEKLLAVVHESHEYNENSDRRALFYAQSWLFVHFIIDNNRIADATDYFVKSMYRGMTITQAIESAFKMKPAELDAELHDYLKEKRVKIRTVPLPEKTEAVTYVARKLKDYEALAVVAELQLHTPERWEAAMKTFESLTSQYSFFAAGHSGLGYAYDRKGDLAAAEKSFRRAAELDSTDAYVYYFIAYAVSQRLGNRVDPEDLVEMNELLDKAIKLQPTFAEAYNLKAFALSSATNVTEAVDQMKIAVSLEPRNERFQMNLVRQYMAARRFAEASALLERLKKSADPAMVSAANEAAEQLQKWKENPLNQLAGMSSDAYIAPQWRRKPGAKDPELEELEAAQTGKDPEPDMASGPVKFLKGVLVSTTCAQDGSAILNLTVGAKRLKLHTRNSRKVLIMGANEFQCDWRNKRVSVNYRQRGPGEGELVSLEVAQP